MEVLEEPPIVLNYVTASSALGSLMLVLPESRAQACERNPRPSDRIRTAEKSNPFASKREMAWPFFFCSQAPTPMAPNRILTWHVRIKLNSNMVC